MFYFILESCTAQICHKYTSCKIDPVTNYAMCFSECGINNGGCLPHLSCRFNGQEGKKITNQSSQYFGLNIGCYNPLYSKFNFIITHNLAIVLILSQVSSTLRLIGV